MKRKSSPSRRRHKDPYPYIGTPEGDEIIGTCDGRWCGRELRRGDRWFTLLSGHLVCISCWHKPMEEWLPQTEPEKVIPVPAEEPAPQAAEPEDFGPDNPYF